MEKENTPTNIALPKVIFGTSALGNLYEEISVDIKTKIISECLQHAQLPVVFDSAGKYGAGLSLEMLGKILTDLNVNPDNVIISNKLGWLRTELKTIEPTFEPGAWKGLKNDAVQRISYKGILECLEQGNELLGGRFVPQLLSVHDPDEYLNQAKTQSEYDALFNDIIEAYKALSDKKKEGKVKAIGVGAKDWKTIQKIEEQVDLDWVMFANSMTIMNHPAELVTYMEKLKNKGVTIVNSAVFQAGFLLGGDYYDYRKIARDTAENIHLFDWRDKFHAICKEFNVLPMHVCVNFALQAPGVKAIALNTSNPLRIKDNVASVNAEIPSAFYLKMKEVGLIEPDYKYI